MDLLSCRPFLLPESQLFRSLLNEGCCGPKASNAETFSPRLDVKEEEHSYKIATDVPGVDPKDIEITFENGVLTIRGEKKTEASEERAGFKRVERTSGQFLRQLRLPEDIDTDAISASGKNGVLEIVVPKSAKAQPKKITVQ